MPSELSGADAETEEIGLSIFVARGDNINGIKNAAVTVCVIL